MIRVIAGALLGYVVLALLLFAVFNGAYLIMGAERAFRPGSYQVSGLWIGLGALFTFAASLVGGYVAAAVSRGTVAPLVLACAILVLGVIFAIPALGQPDPGPRTGDVGNFAAMQYARQPAWTLFFNPVIAAIGVLVGSRLRRTRGR